MKRDREFIFFFLGQVFSQLGSLTYAAVLPALLLKNDISLVYIGVLVAALRITGVGVNAFVGHLGDRVSPRTIVIVTEAVAAIAAVAIGLIWSGSSTNLALFLALNVLRTAMTSLQATGAQKIIKTLDDRYAATGRLGVWLNNTSSTGMFLGALVAVLFFDQITVPILVAFDAATFVINGILILLMTRFQDVKSSKSSFQAQFNPKRYFKTQPNLFGEDMALALVLMGSNTFNLLLLSQDLSLAPILPGLFGLSGLVASFALRSKVFSKPWLGWLLVTAAFALTFLSLGDPISVAVFTTLRNFGYWLIFHRITQELVRRSDSATFASIAAGRLASTTAVLGLGEIWLGKQILSVKGELIWRGALSGSQIVVRAFGGKQRASSSRVA